MFVICLAICPPVIAGAQSTDETEVRILAEKFYSAYQSADLEGLMRLLSDKSPDRATLKQSFQQTVVAKRVRLKSATIRKIDFADGKAEVHVIEDIISLDATIGRPVGSSTSKHIKLKFIKEGEAWKVWQYVLKGLELAVALISAKTNEERERLLEAEKELVTAVLVQRLLDQGLRHNTLGNLKGALDIFALALDVANRVDDSKGMAAALQGIGIVHSSRGDYAQALEYYEKSLKILEKIKYKEGATRVLNSIGNVNYSRGNYAEALKYYEKNLEVAKELDDKNMIAITMGGIGSVHVSQGNYTEALKCY